MTFQIYIVIHEVKKLKSLDVFFQHYESYFFNSGNIIKECLCQKHTLLFVLILASSWCLCQTT